VSSVDDRVAKLEAQVARLLEMLAERDAEVARLKRRVAELEAVLGQNSTNSHKPPSSDPPGTRPSKPTTGRQRGAQPGHKPNKRVLLPPEKVTRRTAVAPACCKHCGGRRLKASAVEARVHQVVDVPEIQPDVHEIRMSAADCRDCGRRSWADLPDGVPAHMFGPRLLALIGYLLAARTSRRQLREMLVEIFGIPVSLGALSEAEERTSNAIAAPVDEAIAHVRGQPVKHVDASTWRIEGAYAALWTIATRLVTVFFVTVDARSATVRSLLGALRGILITDRGTQFGFWAMERRQVCWAHLIRKFVAFSERNDEGGAIGDGLLLLSHAMLHSWHRVRDGTLSRRKFRRMADNAQVAIERLLERGAALRLRGLSGACEDVLEHRAALFTFAYELGVEPTNNEAERALRPFVLWRKVSYGSQSARGCLFAQRIITVAHTLRQQRRPILQFLIEACHAAAHDMPSPSLLPATR
jgi:transposase